MLPRLSTLGWLVWILMLVAAEARADCTGCQGLQGVCQSLSYCIRSCGLNKRAAAGCLALKLIDEAKYREVTGEPPPKPGELGGPPLPPAAASPSPPTKAAAGSAPTVSGRLPAEVIQRIVRQNSARFRLCYESGQRKNPKLQGRVTVRFVIGRDGQVSNVGNGGSSLPDAGVVSCVVRAFYGLAFPKPEAGIVTVTYPLHFAPGG